MRLFFALSFVLLAFASTASAQADPAYKYKDTFSYNSQRYKEQKGFLKESNYKDRIPYKTMKQESFLPKMKPTSTGKAKLATQSEYMKHMQRTASGKATMTKKPLSVQKTGSARQKIKLSERDFKAPKEVVPPAPKVN